MPGVQDRVALVTGGAQGIGAEISKRLAAGGAKFGVLDLAKDAAQSVVDEITGAGGAALALSADVSKRDQVQAAVDALVGEYGGLQILVNNAGVLRDNLLFKMTDDDWTLVMDVHLRGAFLCSQIAQRHMVAAKFGRIICMSSTSALGNRGQANYATAKAGLQGPAKTLALELGPFGVTAHAIGPGSIGTEFFPRLILISSYLLTPAATVRRYPLSAPRDAYSLTRSAFSGTISAWIRRPG